MFCRFFWGGAGGTLKGNKIEEVNCEFIAEVFMYHLAGLRVSYMWKVKIVFRVHTIIKGIQGE